MLKKVLQVFCSDSFAGVQQVVLNVCSHLDRSQFIPLIASPGHEKVLSICEEKNIVHITIPFKGMKDLTSVLALRSLVEREEVDLVHAHLGITTVAAHLALLGKKTPLVISRHFIQENYTHLQGWRFGLALGVYKAINDKAAAVVAVSDAVREALLIREKISPDKLITIPNGIELPPPPQEDFQKWEDLREGRCPLQVVCISRMNEEKRVGVLLEALTLLKQKGIIFKAHLVGTGDLLEELKDKSRALGLEELVCFTGFVQSPWPYLEKAHVLVHAAHEEPFGLALLEAGSMALPVVAVASGGPKEIVEHGQTGILVAQSSPQDLAEGMFCLAKDISLAEKMGKNARQRVEEKFSSTAMTRAHEDLYRCLIP